MSYRITKIVVAIDPAVTNTESDETGIIVAGVSQNNRYYVIDDVSGGGCHPDGWGRSAIDMFYKYQADRIVAEVNNVVI